MWTSCVRTPFCALLFLAVISGCAPNVDAQVTGATISGTVTDRTGKVLPNAVVSISNVDIGVTRELTTNDEGFYSAPNLSPGAYGLRVTLAVLHAAACLSGDRRRVLADAAFVAAHR